MELCYIMFKKVQHLRKKKVIFSTEKFCCNSAQNLLDSKNTLHTQKINKYSQHKSRTETFKEMCNWVTRKTCKHNLCANLPRYAGTPFFMCYFIQECFILNTKMIFSFYLILSQYSWRNRQAVQGLADSETGGLFTCEPFLYSGGTLVCRQPFLWKAHCI